MSNPFRQALVASCAYTVFCGGLGLVLPLHLLRGEWLHGAPRAAVSSSATSAPSASASPATQTDGGLHTGRRLEPLEDTPEKLAQCKENLSALGASAQKLDKATEFKHLADATPGRDKCPTTGLRYRWFRDVDRSFLYCSGRGHAGLAVHWDSARGVQESWPEFGSETTDKEKLQVAWTRFLAAQWDEQWQQGLDVLGLIKQLSSFQEWVAVREAECNLNLENLEEADALSAAARNEYPESADALSVRCSVLLADDECEAAEQLARKWRDKTPENESAAITLVLALAHLDRWEDADKVAAEVRDPLFLTYSDLAYKRYTASWENAERTAREQGWDAMYTSHALLTGVLAGPLGAEPEKICRERLSKSLELVPKAWPYPCYRYLNGDISEAELLAAAGDIPAWLLEAKYVVALHLLGQKQETERARQLLATVAEQRYYFESLVAAALLRH